MKTFLSILIISSVLACNNLSKTGKNSSLIIKKDSSLILQVIQRAGAFNNFNNKNDSNDYFFIELNLVNNTDSIFEFITYSCSSYTNVLIDSKQVDLVYPYCSANKPKVINLMPKQIFFLPIILLRNRNIELPYDMIKFGFILPRPIIGRDLDDQFRESRQNLENVIWSDPIGLSIMTDSPYEIRNVIED